MCRQVTDSKHGNVLIYIVMLAAGVSAASLTYAAEVPINPLDAAERMEKLSAMGVLSFCLISSLATLAYLIKLQYGRMMSVIDRNTEATQKVIDAVQRCAEKGKSEK